jgi:hypothetical protein
MISLSPLPRSHISIISISAHIRIVGSTRTDARFWLGGGGQLSDCNSLSGLNSLTNRVLNKKIII